MIKTAKILLIGVTIGGILAFIAPLAWQQVINHRVILNNRSVSESVANRGIRVVSSTSSRVIQPPRVPTTIRVVSGEAKVEGSPISLCLLPMLGLSSGRALEPRIAVQIVRCEGLDLGVSLGISPSTLSVSLDRDLRGHIGLLQNSLVGVGGGIDREGYTRLLVHLSVFL